MSDACIVRIRRPSDLPALATVLVRVHATDGYPVEGVANPMGWLDISREVQSWTGLVGGQPIGQVSLVDACPEDGLAQIWLATTGRSLADLAMVVRLFVDPAHHRVGAGYRLMTAALEHARSADRHVALDVMSKDRAAIRLYERLGGQRIGEFNHRFGDGKSTQAIAFVFPSWSPDRAPVRGTPPA